MSTLVRIFSNYNQKDYNSERLVEGCGGKERDGNGDSGIIRREPVPTPAISEVRVDDELPIVNKKTLRIRHRIQKCAITKCIICTVQLYNYK